MKKLLLTLCREEHGFDLVEYAMLLLFLALSSVAFLDELAGRLIVVLNMANNNMMGNTGF